MMGRQTGDQASLFYEFRLADRIPKDHLLRRINVVVGPVLDGVRGQLKPYYSQIGRPSIDPELMIRMLIVGYCFGLRSERRLTQSSYHFGDGWAISSSPSITANWIAKGEKWTVPVGGGLSKTSARRAA